ncbi:MAG: 6-O-methylguanine DNA methyltransferase [Acidimicrobiia bacterium]|nr:6-O-methylguanine DNA methyltransferase [Acidimicrobiia bacterium]
MSSLPVEGDGRTFSERVYFAVESLAEGEVATYGEIAADAGRAGAARAVGRILANSDGLPWWRVVTKEGRLVPGLEEEHARRLAREGQAIRHNRVMRPYEGGSG